MKLKKKKKGNIKSFINKINNFSFILFALPALCCYKFISHLAIYNRKKNNLINFRSDRNCNTLLLCVYFGSAVSFSPFVFSSIYVKRLKYYRRKKLPLFCLTYCVEMSCRHFPSIRSFFWTFPQKSYYMLLYYSLG